MTDRLSRARSTGVLAVLRAATPEAALEASEAIIRGGITGIEVTFSTPDAPAVIRELIARHGDAAYVGAGTVTTVAQAEAAAEAGAEFLVSPGTTYFCQSCRTLCSRGVGVATVVMRMLLSTMTSNDEPARSLRGRLRRSPG